MADTPFKRGDILQFHHGDVEHWAYQDGSLLLVTEDQPVDNLMNFTGKFIFNAVGRPTGETLSLFSAEYFTKVGHVEGLTDE